MQRTPLYQYHADRGARFVDFAGWEMPILYRSIHEEHHQVRRSGGMFDVSHMGRLKISGRHGRRFLERVLTRRISDMAVGSCRYSLVCNAQGGVRDDVIVYRFEDHWLLVVNASNREKIVAHFQAQVGDMVLKIEDQTLSTAMVAIQGPKVMDMVGRMSREIPTLKRYSFCVKNLLILKLIVSRTGYTGEDGIEVILPSSMSGIALKMLLKDAGTVAGGSETPLVMPAGLGARDTLRMEAAMPLYGHELSEEINPLAAGLNFAVNLDKDQQNAAAGLGDPQSDPRSDGGGNSGGGEAFIGQTALKKIAAAGPATRLVGLKLEGKRTARQGMAVLAGDKPVGAVTSGCLSPTLGYPIAMAYVPPEYALDASGQSSPAQTLLVDLGSQKVAAQVVKLPFYKRGAATV